jgi:hypothetical protein
MCVHLAAIGGHVDVLRHLVWFGANINARVSISVVLSLWSYGIIGVL